MERRRAIRARRVLSIQFRLIKSRGRAVADSHWHLSTTQDMSAVGISFLSEVPFRLTDVLELHMVLSGVIDIYKGSGKVVRVEEKVPGRSYLVAVQFTENKKITKSQTACL